MNYNYHYSFLLSIIIYFLLHFIIVEFVVSSFQIKNSNEYEQLFCGSTELTEQLFHSSPQILENHNNLEKEVYEFMQKKLAGNSFLPNYTLPVVVHIIHNNGPENISDALVFQGIQHLNESFANFGYYDQGTGVNTQIEFCLAQRDPDGNATNGITRDISALANLTMETDDINMKNINRWDPLNYINIWLVNEICSNSSGCGVAGYAYFPSSHGGLNDGIVIEANWMGSSNANSTVLSHEMGHYLGLYHTFQGGCANDDCLVNGDKVCDTPPDQSTAAVPCNTTVNSCTTDVNGADPNNPFSSDQNDMFWNYMDYGNWSCYSAFTAGQATRMEFFVNGTRSSLLSSEACLPACMSPLTASFNSSANPINVGDNVSFTNTSIGATAYEWLIDGVPFSSNTNSSYSFLTEGFYVITLNTTNNDPNCFESFSDTIEVVCPVVAGFDANTTIAQINEIVFLTNTSFSATGYEWTLNGTPQSNSTDYSFSLANPEVVQVCLEAFDSLCSDIFCVYISIISDTSSDCDIPYIKSIGNPQESEGANVIIPSLNDDFFIGGNKEDSAMIVKVTPDGIPVWSKTFKFTNLNDDIWDIKIDSDNNLIVVGYGRNGNDYDCFAFKYNHSNDIIEWVKTMPTPNESFWRNVVEKNIGGNYLVLGQSQPNGSPGQGCDAFIIELDRNDGSVNWMRNYHLGSCETYLDVILDGNTILAPGRFNFAGGGQNRFRASLTRLDFSGNEIWSRLYLVPVNTDARLYASDIVVDGDKIINVAHGDFNGISFSNVDIYLYSTNMDGTINWAESFDIVGSNTERTNDIINLPDGYLVLGSIVFSDRDLFILKTDKQGQIQWAKSYGGNQNDFSANVFVQGDFIYLAGTKGSGSSDEDIFLIKLNMEGELSSPCDDVETLDAIQTSLNNPYDGLHPLTNWDPSFSTFEILNPTANPSSIDVNDICGIDCDEICDNGIDDDGDQLIDYFDPDCPCLDTLACGTPFYNICAPECEFPIPPVSIEMEALWSKTGIRIGNVQMVADVDGDCVPDVLAVNSSGTALEVINSISGVLKYSYPVSIPNGYMHPALADVDNDGMAEIFFVGATTGTARLFRLDYNPSNDNLEETWQSSVDIFAPWNIPAFNYSPSLADFDYNGTPEVYVGNQIFNILNGLELVNGGQNNQGVYQLGSSNFMTSTSIASDLLPNNECVFCQGLELVAGGQVYTVNLASYTNPSLNNMVVEKEYQLPGTGRIDGATRLVDFDRDGDLDVVVTTQLTAFSETRVFVWDISTESLLGNVYTNIPNAARERIGAAAIGDVDNDGWPEIVVATSYNFNILEDYQNGGANNWGLIPATLKATISTSDQSGATGATIFDLNGDGAVEIIYRDENNLRVFDEDLNELAVISCTSGTATEYPVIADLNGDGETEFLCGCENIGLTAFKSANLPWIKARKIWNQYNYFVTNIEDNGSVPVQQQNPHIVGDSIIMNGFLAQQPILDDEGTPINPVADAELMIDSAFCNNDSVNVYVTICNTGDYTLSELTPVAVYFGDPTLATPFLISINSIGVNVKPDSCFNAVYAVPNGLNQPIFIVINDDGSGNYPYDLATDFPITAIGECDFENNIADTEVNGSLPPELDLGPDIIVCDNGVFEFNAGAGFDYYEWQDGSQDSTFTAWSAGTFWVTAWNDCGEIQSDTINVEIDSATVFDLGQDTVLCGGGAVTFFVPGYDRYEWLPNVDIDCDSCEIATVSPSSSTTYTLVASTDSGCISVDSIQVIIADTFFVTMDTSICEGETIIFDGIELQPNTSTYFYYSTVLGCDSTILVNVSTNGFETYFEEIDTFACFGNSILFDGIAIPADSSYIFDYNTSQGCDSTIVVNVIPLDTFYNVASLSICEGESIMIFGNEVTVAGDYSMIFNTINGCDSTVIISLEVFERPEVSLTGEPTCPDDSTGTVSATIVGGNEPFNYNWNVTPENIAELQNLSAGIYSVTVTDVNDCTDSSSIVLNEVTQTPVVGFGFDVSCFGLSDGYFQIDTAFVGYLFSLDGDIYQSSLFFDNLSEGTYDLYIQDPNGCQYSQSFTIGTPPPIILQLPADITIELGDSAIIESSVNVSDSISYSWSPPTDLSCPTCPITYASPTEDVLYTLTVIDSSGCIVREDILVKVDRNRNIFIPNVFSPNYDGTNDVFMIYSGNGVGEILSFTIFDRWGEQIFEAKSFQPNDPAFGWDGTFKGKDMGPAVFVYLVEVAFLDGKKITYKGDVTLVK